MTTTITTSPFFYTTPPVFILEHQMNLFIQFLKEFPGVDFYLLNTIIIKENDSKMLFKKLLNFVCYITANNNNNNSSSLVIFPSIEHQLIIADTFVKSFETVIEKLIKERFFKNKDDIFNINSCFRKLKKIH